MDSSSSFKPAKAQFVSRNDPDDRRLGDDVQTGAPTAAGAFEVFGWPDDEGIKLNGGRPGAALAPDMIRKFLYKMTPDARGTSQVLIHDHGNLETASALGERHAKARAAVSAALKRGSKPLTFGGGHDYGFPDGAAFLENFASNTALRPLVINFDAHLDVRPFDKNFNSGTPFRRLLTEFRGKFDFIELGLQPHCNSRAHRDWALENGAEIWWAGTLPTPASLSERLTSYLSKQPARPVFVSLDIDCISSISAPGCSQAWDTGLSSAHVFAAFGVIRRLSDWRQLSIYEVSPPLDSDDRTSKLAAQYAYDFCWGISP